jgi:hypothetical protein
MDIGKFNELIRTGGLDLVNNWEKYESILETIIKNFLDKTNIEHITRLKIGSRIPDILISKYSLIIECDRLYWHSDKCKVPKGPTYHRDKFLYYKELNYQSLFLRSDEILYLRSICFSLIKRKLNLNKDLSSLDFKIEPINREQALKFLKKNYLGSVGALSKYLGIFNKDELISVASFKKVNREGILSHFCIKNNLNSNNIFKELVKWVINNRNINCIKTTIDLRFEDTKELLDCNFIKLKESISYRWTDGTITFHKSKFSKIEASKRDLGKIYDCGQITYIRYL